MRFLKKEIVSLILLLNVRYFRSRLNDKKFPTYDIKNTLYFKMEHEIYFIYTSSLRRLDIPIDENLYEIIS